MSELNALAKPFGIQFAGEQIGNSVNYLDVNLYLDSCGQIQYKLYKKETDARNFLSPSSFHPNNVFDSVVFSQMLRVIDRNSSDDTCVTDLQDLKNALLKCGHSEEKLEQTEPLAVQRVIENKSNIAKGLQGLRKKDGQVVVFTTKFFKEVHQLKTLVRNMEEDIQQLCGETRIIFALQKHPSIANSVVKNRKLSEGTQTTSDNGNRTTQSCLASGCKLCPLLFKLDDTITINGERLVLDSKLSCKDKGVIYVAQCQTCDLYKQNNGLIFYEDSYFGQTATKTNTRFNGHRNKFVIDDNKVFEKSALSQHCHDCHDDVKRIKRIKR